MELARVFGVSRHCIWYNMQRLDVTRKKMGRYREADTMKRRRFLRLRERYARRGKRFIYLDESGFAPTSARRYGYAPKGQRVYSQAHNYFYVACKLPVSALPLLK